MRKADPNAPARRRLLDAAERLMIVKGYAATSVEDICWKARVSNGSFFHFFPDKEAVARAAVERFISRELQSLRAATFQRESRPLARLLGWVDAAIAVFEDPLAPKACLLGTLTQELAPSHRRFQALFSRLFERWAEGFAADAREAAKGRPGASVEPKALADLYLSLIQGSIILVKGKAAPRIGAVNLRIFKSYLKREFGRPRRSP